MCDRSLASIPCRALGGNISLILTLKEWHSRTAANVHTRYFIQVPRRSSDNHHLTEFYFLKNYSLYMSDMTTELNCL